MSLLLKQIVKHIFLSKNWKKVGKVLKNTKPQSYTTAFALSKCDVPTINSMN